MLFGRRTRVKRPKISSFSSLRVLLTRVQSEFARLEFPNHFLTSRNSR